MSKLTYYKLNNVLSTPWICNFSTCVTSRHNYITLTSGDLYSQQTIAMYCTSCIVLLILLVSININWWIITLQLYVAFFKWAQGSICSWTSAGPVVFENGQALNYFRQTRKKICFTKSPHIKVLLVNKLWFDDSVII